MTLMHILTLATFIALGSLGLAAIQDAIRMVRMFWAKPSAKIHASHAVHCPKHYAKQRLS